MPNRDPIPLCLPCHRKMTCLKNGVIIKQEYEDGTTGCFQHVDLYECNSCGRQHASGFSQNALTMGFLDSFNEEEKRWQAQPEEYRLWWK